MEMLFAVAMTFIPLAIAIRLVRSQSYQQSPRERVQEGNRDGTPPDQ